MKLPAITSPMTYAEIEASLGIRERNELKKNPYALAIELCKRVLSGELPYKEHCHRIIWPLYGEGKRAHVPRGKYSLYAEVKA